MEAPGTKPGNCCVMPCPRTMVSYALNFRGFWSVTNHFRLWIVRAWNTKNNLVFEQMVSGRESRKPTFSKTQLQHAKAQCCAEMRKRKETGDNHGIPRVLVGGKRQDTYSEGSQSFDSCVSGAWCCRVSEQQGPSTLQSSLDVGSVPVSSAQNYGTIGSEFLDVSGPTVSLHPAFPPFPRLPSVCWTLCKQGALPRTGRLLSARHRTGNCHCLDIAGQCERISVVDRCGAWVHRSITSFCVL